MHASVLCIAHLVARERLIRLERERVKRLARYALGEHQLFRYEVAGLGHGGVRLTVTPFPVRVA